MPGATGIRLVVYEDPSVRRIQQHIDTTSQSRSIRAIGLDRHLNANRAPRPALLLPLEERLQLGDDSGLVDCVRHSPDTEDSLDISVLHSSCYTSACDTEVHRVSEYVHFDAGGDCDAYADRL
jgi:hypothetical protein